MSRPMGDPSLEAETAMAEFDDAMTATLCLLPWKVRAPPSQSSPLLWPTASGISSCRGLIDFTIAIADGLPWLRPLLAVSGLPPWLPLTTAMK